MSPALALYLAGSRLAGPLAAPLLDRRAARGKEDRARLGERLGHAARPRPAGPLVWLHGASVGEGLSMLPLIAALRAARPGIAILVTTGTVTSAGRMAALLPDGALHQFAPVDTAASVGRFLDHWRPDLAVWVESEFWPRLMVETARRSTPMILVNARLSEASARAWARAPGMARTLLDLFRTVLSQDAETERRLVSLGADPARVRVAGNLKVAIPPPGADAAELARLRAALSGRPVWLAASTHAPEEELAAEAHRLARERLPGLLTIVAPRHPDRAEAIASGMAGLSVTRRSAMQAPAGDLFLADTLGEMGLWLRLAPVTFVGGSVAPMGGHNPFEPAALGSAVLHGPSTENFSPAYAALAAAGGARPAGTAVGIADALVDLLGPGAEPRRRALAEAARDAMARLMPDVEGIAADALALMRR